MNTAQLIIASLGFVIVVAVLWNVLRRPRHGEGDQDAWRSRGGDDGSGGD